MQSPPTGVKTLRQFQKVTVSNSTMIRSSAHTLRPDEGEDAWKFLGKAVDPGIDIKRATTMQVRTIFWWAMLVISQLGSSRTMCL